VLKTRIFSGQDNLRKFTLKKSRYSEAQIVVVLKEAENGVPVSELCRNHGMSRATFNQWRSKYGGMDASLISEMKQLQAENARLKQMYADIAIQNELVKEALTKK
jgi:putative transposase